MAYRIAAMLIALLLLGAAALWGINGLHQDFGSALQAYEDLRSVYEVASHVATARAMLASPSPDLPRAGQELETAGGLYALYFSRQAADAPLYSLQTGLRDSLRDARQQLRDNPDTDSLNRVYQHVTALAAAIRHQIQRTEADADARRRTTFVMLAILSGSLVLATVVLGMMQYRSVTRPLSQLSQGTRKLAAGQFHQRARVHGHAEFVALADDFNRMADELDELYRNLEQKVQQKSRELVRSERLASVGYLAAGVAHEINNPLGIIAGHAELALQQLRQTSQPPPATEIGNTLELIAEEAFRAKQITDKLLSLAAPRPEQRVAVSLANVVREVVELVAGLPACRAKRLVVPPDADTDYSVLANQTEMKQVVLNLILNALEAIDAGGEVRIELARCEREIELSVSDNGRGMSPDTLERVFEPFFTRRPPDAPRGTGLGLSITHAIVQNHGGSIEAQSAGPGRGSRFVVRLPAAG